MQRHWWKVGIVFAMVAAAVVVTDSAMAHPAPDPGPAIAPPAALSTSGDYATDVLGDPWDFSNDEDVPSILLVGSENSFGISRSADGMLNIDGGNGSTVKLVHTWGLELPWGRDGLQKPIDAAVYSQVTTRIFIPGTQPRDIGVRYVTESGQTNVNFQKHIGPGWTPVNIDLTQPGEFGPSVWAGKVVRLEIAIGGVYNGGADRGLFQVDWASLHRPDVHPTTAPGSAPQPVVKVLSPSEEGGADYATVSGNPWDFAGPDDVLSMGDIINSSFDGTAFNGTTHPNDSFVELPLRTPLNPDRYHRATVDVCYDGSFALTNAAGGGMNARFAWFDEGGQTWSETQDILIYPGCNRMTIDLATTPAAAVNDEGTVYKAGWRGLRITRLRFDLNEDPGYRNFSLRDIRLADDAAFSPPATYPISFSSTTGGTAVLYATTSTTGAFDTAHQIGTMPVVANVVKNFDWDGSGLPNGTYSIWVKVTNNGVVGSAYSTGPVRIERPVLATPSCYVPLNPARVLDTRDGTGGNISALSSQAMTEVKVTGVGGVPPTGATAVVLNVTVDAPISSGFITAWPSGEGQPTVSNLNYIAGQTVPNLVTVKLGANGRVNLYNSEGFTHLVADVVGYYTAASQGCTGLFTAVTPGRVLDTRNGTGQGGLVAPVGAGRTINVAVTGGAFGVPATGVSGVALNVTVDQPTSAGYLTVWPTGDVQPLASSHNFVAGLTVANLVLAKVGTGGQVSIFNSAGSTHVVADVVGYFSARGGTFVPVSPVRIVDSRFGVGQGVTGPLGQQVTTNVAVAGVGPVPSNATAAIVNVTSVNSSLPSFITVWPTGDPKPTASTVNPRPGVPVPNLAYLKLGAGGKLSIFNNTGSTDYIVDVFGYVIP